MIQDTDKTITLSALTDIAFLSAVTNAMAHPSNPTPEMMQMGEDIAEELLIRSLRAGDATLAAAVMESLIPRGGIASGFAYGISSRLVAC